MPVSMTLSLRGDEALRRALDRINPADHPRLFAPVFIRWAVTGSSISKEDYLSGPRSKTRLGVVTHRLRSSVERSVFSPPGYIEFGTDVIYGPTHEFGDTSRNIRARPFIAPAAEEAARDLEDDLVNTWRNEW